jgi:hypothetical protein
MKSFLTFAKSLRKKASTVRRSFRIQMGELESRQLLTANYLILDFTPDTHSGSFADTFYSTKLSNGFAPKFLDFNGDRYVNSTDVSIAASAVYSKVRSFYQPYLNNSYNNLTISYGDYNSNTNWGTQWINYGRAYSTVEVAVMYIGGTNVGGNSILGQSPLASDGTNIEGSGETYSRTIANNMLSNTYATSTDFVNKVANTIAHELGHMMGLRHPSVSNNYNIMSAYQSSTPGSTYFVSGKVNTTNGYQQDANYELLSSFQLNQRQVYSYTTGGRFQLDNVGTGLSQSAVSPLISESAYFVSSNVNTTNLYQLNQRQVYSYAPGDRVQLDNLGTGLSHVLVRPSAAVPGDWVTSVVNRDRLHSIASSPQETSSSVVLEPETTSTVLFGKNKPGTLGKSATKIG